MRRQVPEDGTDEFYDQIDGISAVLERFFGENVNFKAKSEAYSFHGTYSTINDDAWTRAEAQDVLLELEESLVRLSRAYSALPGSLRSGFEDDASQADWLAQQEFLKVTKLDLVTKAHLPKELGRQAALALRDVNAGSRELIRGIRILNNRLPEGIPTRNRPISDWAIVEAAAKMCRFYGFMDVPNSLGKQSPFGRLLEALFAVLGAETTPIGAFNGWKKDFDSKYEKFDLLDME
ncbi:hypothetical protein OAN307_c19800 [Octadecabacter antarcticus 307]|uniref:Uncharacterized protein n=1 Tax=Octadecabacter antarcticus 307 TaxID=391626 RepID=M9R5X9_9RHOB|nr:hypothetical protein [Octadecabacter antarcticus]AGI67627.1 hypothetical protein OAN307_c19800 [Octadecabacter antarcticus 307]